MMEMDQTYEAAIGKKICEILPVEWMRFKMYHSEDIYSCIPMLVFRLNFLDERMEGLKECIASFKGKERWDVFVDPFSKKGNYILTIEIVKEIYQKGYENGAPYREREYLGEGEYRLRCEHAIQDIPALFEHICRLGMDTAIQMINP